ncbi:hypothetical protein FRC07_001538 [Ceratobasidium sp. 392]|nr:hypothetical protein FRC07_001538 [Ceratobasidium sp. 392]
MILDYNGTSWNGYFASEFLFADKFRCTTEVVLPSANYPGRVSFKNSDDTFTCSELAKAIDPSIDLSTVPVIGGDLLASLRLDQASIEITYADGKYSISSFMIALDWGAWNIGQLKTSNNRLSISWRKESSSEPDGSTEGTETTLAETTSTENTSTWAIGWEGNLFTDWHLSANLHRSTTKVSEGESKTATILFGAILGPVERIHSGSLINSLTSASDNSNDPLWNQTVPKNVKSSFQLAECAVGLVLREDSQTFAAGARATWGENGQGTGLVLVEKSKATTEDSASKWGFAFAISVSNFRFTDLMSNNSFAQSVDDTLSIKRVSILVFRNPGGMGLSRIYQLVKNASACGLLPAGVDLLPPKSPNKKSSPELTAGAAVFALLHFPSAKEGSLTHNLNTVGGSKLSSVEIMGYFGKATDKTPTTIFSASISSISLFQSVILEEVKLTYAPVSSIDEEKLDDVANAFSLSANCRIQFSSESTWDIKGSFTITKKDAKLVADLTTGTRSLSETLGLQISDVRFAVDYTFSSSPDPSKEGADKPESRKHKSTITLAAKAQIGSITADASVEFDDGKPGVLSVRVPGKLSVSDLFNRIFGTSISKDLLDIEFSKLLVYYAWKASKASTGQDEPESPTYTAGFHAEADTSIFGVLFSLAVDISGGEDKGFSISGTKATPVEVLGLVLHGATSEAAGPRLRFSTRAKDKGCSIEAGLKLFGTSVGSITLAYNSQKSQFLGTVGVKAKFLPGGQASVSFELVKKDEKHVLRLVELPAVFDDLVKAMHIIETIKKLSAADGSPCGAITLAFNQLSTKLHVKLTIPESQKGLSPDKGSEGGSKLNLNINGSFDISIFNHSITSIEFEPFLISIDIPKSFTLDAFASSVVSSLEKSAEQIVQGLWDNQGKLDEVIALVALEKIGEKAIKTLVCRGKYRPKSNPRDKPGRDQKPRGGDGGGSSGDGLFGGIFWPGSSSGSSRKRKPRPSEPSWPPPTPPEGDVIGQHIYEAITKDFTRWKRCTDYQQAIDTALACALEYREAIFLLRKVLRSAESVLKLGERVYNDYNQRLDLLVYDFSMLKWQFGEQWLDMADYEVELKAHSSTTNGRKLDISWNNLRLKGPMRTAVTAQIEGEAEPRLELKSFENSTRTTIDIPVFSGSENLAVKVQVWAIGEVRGGDPEYVFRSWGELAYGILDEVSVGTEVLDFNSKFSQFTLHSSAGSLTANGHIPVLLLGSYRYWPMNYVDNRSAVGLVAQSVGTLNETKRWKRDGDNSISSITHDASTVTFIGQHAQGVKFTLDELSLPDSRYLRTRIAIRDATSQPSLPFEGPSYEASVKDTKKYPVALAGTRTWWPMLFPDSPTLISLVGYDSDLQFIERIDWELDSVGGRIDRLNHIQDPGNPDNNRVEVYNTEGGRITSFGFEGLYS